MFTTFAVIASKNAHLILPEYFHTMYRLPVYPYRQEYVTGKKIHYSFFDDLYASLARAIDSSNEYPFTAPSSISAKRLFISLSKSSSSSEITCYLLVYCAGKDRHHQYFYKNKQL